MARTSITDAPAARSFSDVEKLFLEPGEKARIYLIEEDWLVEYAHEVRRKAKPTKAEEQAGATSAKEDFYGSFLCLGDPAVLGQGDADPERCPFCAAVPHAAGKVLTAKAGFATNIIRYATSKLSHELTRPASVKLLAWKHQDDRKRRAVKDLQEEWGDLRARDVNLTCETVYQQYAITVAAKAGFEEDPALWQLINDTYQQNKYSDEALADAIGRKVDQAGAERAIAAVMTTAPAGYAAAPVAAAGVVGAAPVGYAPPAAPVGYAPPAAPVAAPPVPQAAPPVPAAVDLGGLSTPAPVAAPPIPQAAPVAAPPVPVAVPVAAPPVPVAAPVAAPPVPQAAPVAQEVPVAAPPVPQAAPAVPPLPIPQAAPVAPPVPQAAALPPLAGQ